MGIQGSEVREYDKIRQPKTTHDTPGTASKPLPGMTLRRFCHSSQVGLRLFAHCDTPLDQWTTGLSGGRYSPSLRRCQRRIGFWLFEFFPAHFQSCWTLI